MVILYIATVVLALSCVYVLFKTKSFYEQGQPLSVSVSMGWLIVDSLDILIIVVSAAYSVWRLPLDEVVIRVVGIALTLLGVLIMLAGMIEFHSTRRIMGMEVSSLVTTGIYKWSRNPQFLGWYFIDVGIALTGLSGYALLIALLTIISGHYYIVKLEEPYLERVFGREYLEYKRKTPRYIGLPKD